VHRAWRRAVTRLGIGAAVDHSLLQPFWGVLTLFVVTLGWIPFRAPDFAATAATLRALAGPPDATLIVAHPAIAMIPLLSLGFCWIDRGRRVQDWLVERASFSVAVACCVLVVLALQLFGQIDAQIPFVYFQF
jgi:hypothetical protein